MTIGYKDPQLEILKLQAQVRSLEGKLRKARGETLPKRRQDLQQKVRDLRKANWDLTFALLHEKERNEELAEHLWITHQKPVAQEYNRYVREQ